MATKKRTMTADHKTALAKGRASARAVKDYLVALDAAKPKRGRKVSRADLEKRLASVKQEIVTTDSAMRRLELAQQRIDLEARLAANGATGPDLPALEKEFVKHAKAYSEAKGITYAAWREVGVGPAVLKSAAISRGGALT
jgi:hypothetical protein